MGTMTTSRARALCCIAIFVTSCASFMTSCARPAKPPVEDLRGRENLSGFALAEMRGTRDGDRLDARAKFADGLSTLTVTMRFAIGAPTKLESGRWGWDKASGLASGTVAERSVMFLGGQDGAPSLGGRFDLLDANGVAAYRITIPTQELAIKFQRKTER
jgi:hypothetical protein